MSNKKRISNMKNIFRKYSLVAMAAFAALALGSCAADDEDFTPGAIDSGAYLYTNSNEQTFTPDNEEVLKLNVGRMDTTTAATYNLSSDNPTFPVPSTVSFAAGESSKEIDIPFTMEIGTTQTVTFALPSEQGSGYGEDTLTVTVTRDYNWVSAGEGTFVDNTFTGSSAKVNIYHVAGTTLYRLYRPLYDIIGSTANIQFNMDDKGNVTLADGIYSWFAGDYAEYQAYYDTANYPGYCNVTNENGVITFNFLPLKGKDVYTGGQLIFQWTKGYPVKIAESK